MRIEQKGLQVFADSRFVLDQALGEVAVGFEASRNVSGADAFESTFHDWNLAGKKTQAYADFARRYMSLAYSALACFKTETSGSASFHKAKKS